MNNWALLFATAFVAIPMLISSLQKLGLGRDLGWAAVRAFVQLMAVGFVLKTVFALEDIVYVVGLLTVMTFLAVKNAAQRGRSMRRAFLWVFAGIVLAEVVSVTLWLSLGIVEFKAEVIIPMTGMVIGNAMVAAGLTLERLHSEIKTEKGRIQAALALGAPARKACGPAIRRTIRAAMIPTIDSLKTMGLVHLPGMMTGLILGGASPLTAVRFQIVIIFTISSAVALAAFVVALTAYKEFFNKHHQLRLD